MTLYFIVSVSNLKVSLSFFTISLSLSLSLSQSPCEANRTENLSFSQFEREARSGIISVFVVLQDKTWLRVRRRRVAAWALRSGVSFPCTCQLLTVDSNTAECRAIKLRQCQCQHCWGNYRGAGWQPGGGLWLWWANTGTEQNMIIKWDPTPVWRRNN